LAGRFRTGRTLYDWPVIVHVLIGRA
jgi:hypothetical protein